MKSCRLIFLKSIYGIEKYFPGNEVPEEKYFQNTFTDKNQFVRQNEILLQNRLRIFDCNE